MNGYCQNGQYWATAGNPSTTGDFIGTINLEPLIFKVNNTTAFQINTTGSFIINSLANKGEGLMQFDKFGKITPLIFNYDNNSILTGDGIWSPAYLLTGWKINGNDIVQTSNGNVGIGTSAPQTKLDVNGSVTIANDLKISGNFLSGNFSGGGNRLLQTDASGVITPFTMGTSSQILLGDGTWAALPTLPPAIWQNATNGLDIFNTTGNVGIGTTNPQYLLDVNGNVRISNNLYVGGGIIITDQVNAASEVNTDYVYAAKHVLTKIFESESITTDSIMLDSTKAVYGEANFNDDVVMKSNLAVSHDVKLQSKLSVIGDAVFNGNLVTSNLKLGTAGNNYPINTLALSTGGSLVAFGINPQLTPSCIPAYTGGNVQSNRLSVLNTTNNNVVDIRNDGINGYIDFGHDAVTSINPTIALKINSLCSSNITLNENGGDIFMCNPAIGKVGIGTSSPTEKLEVAGNTLVNGNSIITGNMGIGANTPYKKLTVNGDVSFANYNTSGTGNMSDGMSGFEILGNDQTPTRRGISLDPDPNGSFNFFINSNQGSSAFNFKNGNNDVILMKINANGNVGIGTDFTSATFNNIYKLAVNGSIRAKELVVETNWSDFVFDPTYKLMSLENVEKYIKIYSHLPNIPTAHEIATNGLKVAETQTMMMQKIEELTLYIIEQNKMLKELQTKVVELEKSK